MGTSAPRPAPVIADAVMALNAVDIDELPWQPVAGCRGVFDKELWRSDGFVHALIRYEPGASTPGPPHPMAYHHIWVVRGDASIGDCRVAGGSYVFIPAAQAHPIRAIGPEGCTLLQMHHPAR
jgi:ChrR-like protein with cupin domain